MCEFWIYCFLQAFSAGWDHIIKTPLRPAQTRYGPLRPATIRYYQLRPGSVHTVRNQIENGKSKVSRMCEFWIYCVLQAFSVGWGNIMKTR